MSGAILTFAILGAFVLRHRRNRRWQAKNRRLRRRRGLTPASINHPLPPVRTDGPGSEQSAENMETIGTWWMWAGFAAFVVIAIAVDLLVMQKQGAPRQHT